MDCFRNTGRAFNPIKFGVSSVMFQARRGSAQISAAMCAAEKGAFLAVKKIGQFFLSVRFLPRSK